MNRQTCPPAVVFPPFHIRDDHIAVLVQHNPARPALDELLSLDSVQLHATREGARLSLRAAERGF